MGKAPCENKHTWRKHAFANSIHIYVITLPQPPMIVRMSTGKSFFLSFFCGKQLCFQSCTSKCASLSESKKGYEEV